MDDFALENPVIDRLILDTSALDDTSTIEHCIRRLHTYDALDNGVPFAEDDFKQDAMITNIQRLAMASIHLAYRWARADNLGVPKTPHEAFDLLYQTERISESIRDALHTLVDDSNTLIDIDHDRHPDLIVRITRQHLSTPLAFANLALDALSSP